MNPSTRRRALDAAAKVAFSLSVFGCSTTGLTASGTEGGDASPRDGAASFPDRGGGESESGGGGSESDSMAPTATVDASASDGPWALGDVIAEQARDPADAAIDVAVDPPVPSDATVLACNAPPLHEDFDAA